MSVKNVVQPIEVQTIDSGSVGASYTAINSSGIEEPIFLIRITNDSNQAITISYDGSTDHDYILAGDSVLYNFQTNARPYTGMAALNIGTVVYVKGTSGTGTIAIAGWYQATR